jgi:hypothetical protein
MPNTFEDNVKHLTDAQYITTTLAASIAGMLAKRYSEKRAYEQDKTVPHGDSFSRVAVYMSQMPPEIQEQFKIDTLLFLDSMLITLGYTMAEQNRQILAVVRDLLPEQE